MRNLNLDHVQTLVAIADLGTLAAAAQALHLAAPTVSLHISELESRLGAVLLVRGRRQARLTPAGELLVRGGRHLLAGASGLGEQVRRRAQGLEGVVRLASTAGVSARMLPQLLQALTERSPGVDLRLDVLSSSQAMARLRAGALDVAIVALPQTHGADIHVQPWRNDPVVAWLPPGWKAPKAVTPAWLAERDWMCFDPSTRLYQLAAGWFARAGLSARPQLELNHPDAIRALVAAGRAAALLPLEHGDAPDGSTMQQRPLKPPLLRPLGLACRASDADDPVLQSVLQALQDVAGGRA
ncbi:LysR family transcriptional regulator [Pseudorhodoferax sp.]|uniref:LysR family transcriptional regulator n=1 Tax=Pseudorhodoferax sp. TaxID=1993553 RepID=UPI002DD624B2|nr:LysR family transcriptional regulator [Pseudorhodoferax sp.]